MVEFQDFKDRFIVCCDCGKEFLFSAGEQKFYYHRGLLIPKRCSQCRLIKKLDRIPEAKGDK